MKKVAIENLMQIKTILQQIDNDAYVTPIDLLSGATIGQHVRHIVEFYMLLVAHDSSGELSYDVRKRDTHIETDAEWALKMVDVLLGNLVHLDVKKPLVLLADYTKEGLATNRIHSTVGRELAYCIEHSVHHQAMLKVAINMLGLSSLVDDDFGVAYSTIRYKKISCAQ